MHDTEHGGNTVGVPPNWSVDTSAFGTSINLIVTLFFDGQRALNDQTRIAAFVVNQDNNIVGVYT